MTNQKNQPQKNKQGFTIIEVVLVLAIAGLIFLMVFIALPALQRSQRDTQRRNDMARLATALTQYQANHGGDLPAAGTDSATFITGYLGGSTEFNDPSFGEYTINFEALANNAEKSLTGDASQNIYVELGAKCNGEKAKGNNKSREYAILFKLEGAGTYCQDNS